MQAIDESGIIYDLQRFSVHDGPGIRSLVFFKGCPLRCKWCSNPESLNRAPEILLDSAKCISCRACVTTCNNDAVRVEGDTVHYDRSKCRACGLCAQACYAEARVLKGTVVTVEWVVAAILKDEVFFANSRGGVTLGGGEPLTQPEFASAILQRSRERGLHTTIETCGHVPWAHLEMVLPWTDLFLFDVKHLDPLKHRAHTSGDVDLVQSNLAKLAGATPSVVVRVPVVPTFNDDPMEIAAIAERVAGLGLSEIHLLPYHALGRGKYRLLGREYPYTANAKLGGSQLEELTQIVRTAGLQVKVGG